MATRTLDHAAVRIHDLQRSRQFYEGLLGLTPVERPELGFPGMWYGLGEAQFHLMQTETAVSGGIDPTAPHCAIQVDDLEAVRRRLREAGLELLELGPELLWVRDPDGNTVELRTSAAAAVFRK
jgi:glyoxylase I family protein